MQLIQKGNIDAQCVYLFGCVMMQMSAKAGLKKHCAQADEALLQEFMSLHKVDVYEMLDPTSFTKEQGHAALQALKLLKEKRDGCLKGRTAANRHKQRALYTKVETSLPTLCLCSPY
jgi:hypothetical protein